MDLIRHGVGAAGWALLACAALTTGAGAQAPPADEDALSAPAIAPRALRRAEPRLEPARGPAPRLRAPRAPAAERGRDEGSPLLWSTVGYVVPMPGTEMVRVGVVQEGATLQAANRNPALEGLLRDDVSRIRDAVIHVIIRRPGS